MTPIIAADPPTGTTDRLTLIVLGLFTLVGVCVTAVMARKTNRDSDQPKTQPGVPNNWVSMNINTQEQVNILSRQVNSFIEDANDQWRDFNAKLNDLGGKVSGVRSDVTGLRREMVEMRHRLTPVEEPAWDGKTERRRPNPPPYKGPERRGRYLS